MDDRYGVSDSKIVVVFSVAVNTELITVLSSVQHVLVIAVGVRGMVMRSILQSYDMQSQTITERPLKNCVISSAADNPRCVASQADGDH